ncbi:FAA hydrolase family protein [Cellvibrio sp. KB43]|uniref:FAA hydrolase family protein n=2 Tax=Cellvibrio polysaccharolyticus TaxID=2082724 RepID=A0A928UYL1_9GAMM|nr:FAA hydrolase family protein [Cellvibrio polysaccharolyticus]
MGHNPDREAPFFFFKPQSALLPPGEPFKYPWFSKDVHHELELVIAIGEGGYQLTLAQAKAAVSGFAVGLDMTCRDVQQQAKQQGRPWELAKGFDGSAPCSAIQRGSYEDLQQTGELQLLRNGSIVQQGDWRQMIWPVAELIAEVSRYIRLQPGDLIFTGTPAGVGPVTPGDQLQASLAGSLVTLNVDIVEP